MVPRYNMDIAGTHHANGMYTDFTHKKRSNRYDTIIYGAYFEVSGHPS